MLRHGVVDPVIQQPDQARWFAEEVKPHEAHLRSWLAFRYPMLRDVDDVVQETYVRLFHARNNGGVRSAKAFLFAAARNAACDFFRRQRPKLFGEHASDLAATLVLEEGPDAAETAALSQELEILAEAIRDLPSRCRQVFTLRKIYGLSQREVAENLGISEHTVEVQMVKGVKRCADFFHARGLIRR